MVTRYNLLFDESPEEFDLSQKRFTGVPIQGIVSKVAAASTLDHQVYDQDVEQVMRWLDLFNQGELLPFSVPNLANDFITDDLNLADVVKHILRPRFTPVFQLSLIEGAPVDRGTTVYRQEGVRELVEKPAMAKELEDVVDTYAHLICKVLNRSAQMQTRAYAYAGRRQGLKLLNRHNLEILQTYCKMVHDLEATVADAESRPMQRLQQYVKDVKDSDFFKDIHPVFDVAYFKNYRLSVDVSVGRDGVFAGAIYRDSELPSKIPGFRFIKNSAGMAWAFVKMLSLPTTYAMDATNSVVQGNLNELLKLGEIVGALEFYTGSAGFHRRMTEIDMPVTFPEITPIEERSTHFEQARNPLLLYQQGADQRNVKRVISNPVESSPEQNVFVITGRNNGGKTCYVKTAAILQLMGQSGMPITVEGEASLSPVDGIYTHFVTADDLMAGEGRLLNELRRVRQIIGNATPFSYVILDEPCGGTSPHEGSEQSLVILDALHRVGSTVYFTTHLHQIADAVDDGRYAAGTNRAVELAEDPVSGAK